MRAWPRLCGVQRWALCLLALAQRRRRRPTISTLLDACWAPDVLAAKPGENTVAQAQPQLRRGASEGLSIDPKEAAPAGALGAVRRVEPPARQEADRPHLRPVRAAGRDRRLRRCHHRLPAPREHQGDVLRRRQMDALARRADPAADGRSAVRARQPLGGAPQPAPPRRHAPARRGRRPPARLRIHPHAPRPVAVRGRARRRDADDRTAPDAFPLSLRCLQRAGAARGARPGPHDHPVGRLDRRPRPAAAGRGHRRRHAARQTGVDHPQPCQRARLAYCRGASRGNRPAAQARV